ncbi:competence protein [Soehngenia saccharolytica]|nr:competence protein [Soehngenia saccharolytica]
MDYFSKREKILIGIIALLLVVLILFLNPTSDNNDASELLITNDTVDKSEEEENAELPTEIMVHISGQVYQPGLYKLNSGGRVIDAVNLAGGLTKDADFDRINLAKKISDEEKIYIPKVGENVDSNLVEENSAISDISGNTVSSDKININTCTKQELIDLPGIGDVLADRIIEYRRKTKFSTIEDIKNVSGIGDAKFNAIKELITTN